MGIPRRPAGQAVPLSYAQRRLWFLEQWSPRTHAYNATFPLRLSGRLDGRALRGALTRIVERHEALRTVVDASDGEPRPRLLDAAPVDVPLADLTGLRPATRSLAAERLVARELRRSFDITRDVLLRATLVRLEPDEHILVLVSHHIACDGWSKNILFDELSELYSAAVEGRAAVLAELPIQYADFACWQERRLQGKVLEELVGHWRERLEGAPFELDMPTDYPRPRRQSFKGAVHWVGVSPELTQRARSLGRQESATLYMTLLAVYGAFLWARTGQSDVIVGSPIAGRDHVETEGLIGFFANTLPMRIQLSPDDTFRQLVRRVQAGAVAAYAHRELPFEQLVQALAPARDARRNPICQVNFRVEPPDRTPAMTGLEVSALEVDPGLSRFELALELQEQAGGGLGGYLEYDTALFTPASATTLANEYGRLLEAVLTQPDTPLRDVRAEQTEEHHAV
jgi:hypothetical protein